MTWKCNGEIELTVITTKKRAAESLTRQRNRKNVTILNLRARQSIDIHQITDGGGVPGGDSRQCVDILDNVRHVNRGQIVVRVVEASARERDAELRADGDDGGVGELGPGVGVLNLVGRDNAAVDGGGDGGEGVGGAGLVGDGAGFADAVDAGAADGDLEEELGGEDVVLDVGDGDVDGVGEEEGDGVDGEEGGHLRDLEVGVEGVAHQGWAGVGVGAGLDGRLRGGAWEERPDG